MSESSKHVYDATLDAQSNRKAFFASSTLVTATGFFRLSELYNTLSDTVLPALCRMGSIKIWSAGCSDGREPYSVALAVQKWIHEHPKSPLSLFELRASDITDKMIQTGIANQYEVAANELERLKDYTSYLDFKDKKIVSINKDVRRRIRFVREDIISHRVTSKYNILICTNVLFYYEMEYRKKIVAALITNLHPNGFIYLESIGSRFMRSIGLERVGTGNHFFRFIEKPETGRYQDGK